MGLCCTYDPSKDENRVDGNTSIVVPIPRQPEQEISIMVKRAKEDLASMERRYIIEAKKIFSNKDDINVSMHKRIVEML